MRWEKSDAMWKKRGEVGPGKPLTNAPDITYKLDQWEIPGETALDVKVCKRQGHPLSEYSNARSVPRTSIMLHVTAGYDSLAFLMGGKGVVSVHFIVGRDGSIYQLVPTELIAWHGNEWAENSVGIEVENVGPLNKKGNDLMTTFPKDSPYCTLDEKGVYLDVKWPSRPSIKYWANFTEEQYRGLARLLKAISHKHKIPRVVQPDPVRYEPLPLNQRTKFRGLLSHVQVNPANRADIGPVIDWDKLLRYAEYELGDPMSPPDYKVPVIPTPVVGGPDAPGGGKPASGGAASSGGTAAGGGATPSGGGSTPAPGPTPPAIPSAAASGTTQTLEPLPPPQRVADGVVRVSIGKRGGRVAFTLRKPGEPLPSVPKPGDLPPPQADGKRDDFIRAAMNFLGCAYKAGGTKPAEGVDGPGLIALCLRRVELLKDVKDPIDGPSLAALWPMSSGSATEPPPDLLPGDLAWFGAGDHDTVPTQHPMIFLGGARVLGPVPGGPNDGVVQVILAKDVPEKFAGWQHIDDLGVKTLHTLPPGEQPPGGTKLGPALLPHSPDARYDALKAIVEKKGGAWLSEKNKVNLVGVKDMADRCQISPGTDVFNDTLFAAFLDDDGHKCCLDLKASLNPENDTDKKGTWQLAEGTWKFKLADGDGTPGVKALQPDGNIKGWLDKDGLGAPRGGDLVPPSKVKTDPIPLPPSAHPDHPDHPESPKNTPALPPDPSKPIAKTTGDWHVCIDQDSVPGDIVDQIVQARKRYPAVEPKPYPAGKKYLPNPRVYVRPDNAHRAWAQGSVQTKIDAATKKVDKFMFKSFQKLLGREGGTSDFNLWDTQIVTWGMGFGGLGGLGSLMTHLQSDEAAKNELHNIGFWFESAKQRYHIVDTDNKKVISSGPPPGKYGPDNTPPLTYWNGCDDLVSAFVGMAISPGLRTAVLDANVQAYKGMSGAFSGAEFLDNQAAFNFISHLYHWLPTYADNTMKAARDKGCGDDLSIVTYGAQRFVARANRMAKGGFSKDWRVLMHGFWNTMKGDGLAVPDASTVDFDAGE